MDSDRSPPLKFESLPGLLLFIAGAIILMGIITAEIFYPAGYTTANSEISDLGATRPLPVSVRYQPSASIFNATMVIGGLLILAASLILFRTGTKWTLSSFPHCWEQESSAWEYSRATMPSSTRSSHS